jgi:hypothetical protein
VAFAAAAGLGAFVASAATASETSTQVVEADDAQVVVEQVGDDSTRMDIPDLEPGEVHVDSTADRTIYTYNVPQP